MVMEMFDLTKALSERFSEVDPLTFYRDLFPEGSFEKKGVFVDGRYNGIAIEVFNRDRVLRHTVTDDLEKISELISRDNFCLMSPISYIGKSRKSENARDMYALAIDLDGVSNEREFKFLMTQIERGEEMRAFVWGLPRPTYIVSSGTGLHLYYAFSEPLRLYPNVVKELSKLKKRLTWQAWTQGASSLHDSVQYESLFQGFRVVGTVTKVGTRSRVFKTGVKVDIDYLNFFVPEEFRAENLSYTSNLSLEEAAKKYPDWYERRIVKGTPKGTWTCKRDLYDWWIRRLRAGAEQGHRYWCLMVLAVYAKKSGIKYEELSKDALGLVDFLDSLGDGTDPFTEEDALDALEAYNDSYITYPIKTIVERTGIPIERNKRNGRKQVQHLKLARFARDLNYEDGKRWDDNNGRPKGSFKESTPKGEQIRAYAEAHPDANHSEIARALGVSRPTVIKWLRDNI